MWWFLFFKQKTAYEMRISDWSSDVCSSDLHFSRLAGQCRDTVWGGDCYNYGLVASGHVDIVVEAGLKLHDLAALVPVVEGAGGRMCDWAGEPLTHDSDGQVIALGDAPRLDDVLEALAAGPAAP